MSLRAGTILGFPIRVDSSWFILFFLILWSFSTGVFPARVPGHSQGVYLLMGAVGAILFFVSLLIHELAHALVARLRHIPVDGITLFLFGGMAQTRMEASRPRDEFQIAIVGPLASLLLAALLLLFTAAGVRYGWPLIPLVIAQYLGYLNVVLAIFNMLPGFPLDGGRVLRAIVWRITNDALKATRVASATGKLLGYAMVAWGIVGAVTGNIIGGLWLMFIGWFLRNAANAAYRHHALRALLGNVHAQEAMVADPVTVPPELTILQFVEQGIAARFSSFPVVAQQRLLGLITQQQAREVPRQYWEALRVADIMIPATQLAVVAPEATLIDIIERLRTAPAQRILVMREDALLGIIAPIDLRFWLDRGRFSGN